MRGYSSFFIKLHRKGLLFLLIDRIYLATYFSINFKGIDMTYDPHAPVRNSVRAYFSERTPDIIPLIDDFLAAPSLATARRVMASYFRTHQQGDIQPLVKITSLFASKPLVRGIVQSILEDEEELSGIAARSYPHPIGFDKLVLYHDKTSDFKFRLHIYWRGNKRADMERLHLHKFEMASAIVGGEMTNHIWKIREFDNQTGLIPGIEINSSGERGGHLKEMFAYSGYLRDPQGVLHKTYLGRATLERGTSATMIAGQSYAQSLEDGHYVETNAETGTSNGDICSTIYVHGAALKDSTGRKIPILFEDNRLPDDDQIIGTIPPMTVEDLRTSLTRYRDFMDSSIEFYNWLYDPKHGRNLSTGMMAGYLLAEKFNNPHTISLWLECETECRAELKRCSTILERLVKGDMSLDQFSDDDRTKRYFTSLLNKAESHPRGKEYWLENYGDLVKEMWRYCGALRGEKPDLKELKPIWTDIVGRDLPGGAHYGHIAAMLEAGFKAKNIILSYFRADSPSRGDAWKEDFSPFSVADSEAEDAIRATLLEHYPGYRFKGEESGEDTTTPPQEGEHRWLVDGIDGSRNFMAGRPAFCSMIACQHFTNGAWETTDSVIVDPLRDQIWWAEKGHGAYCIEGKTREYRVHVPAKEMFNNFAQGHPLHRRMIDISVKGLPKEAQHALTDVIHDNEGVYRSTGTTGLMLVSTADGQNDGVVATAHDYDIEPGKLIAREAGASIREIFFMVGNQERIATIQGATPEISDALAAALLPHLNPSVS